MSKLATSTSLPASWSFVPLKELGDWSGGGTPSKAKPKYWQDGTIPWVSPKDMKTERISDSEDHITRQAVSHSTASLINSGSVLIVTRSGILRHTLPVAVNLVPVTINQDLKALTPRKGVMADYVAWALRAFSRDILNTCSKQGTTVNSIETFKLLGFEIPVAPPEQQRRIVAEIEKQFSRLDDAVANLRRVKANLKRYKAAVLKAAVEGKLTEEWRLSARAASRKRAQASELETIPKAGKEKWFIYIIECNDGSYYVGHTADLHARWQAHCEGSGADWTRQHPPKYLVHFEECGSREDAVKREQDLKTGFGRTWRKREIDAGRMKPLVHNPANETAQPVHDEDMQTGSKLLEHVLAERRAKWNGKGKYKEPLAPNTTVHPTLPKSWVWASLEQLSWDSSYGTSVKCSYENSGPTVLRIPNIESGRLDLGDLKFAPRSCEIMQDEELSIGDVLIIRTNGSRSLIGRCAVVRQPLPSRSTYASYLIRFRLVQQPEVIAWVNAVWDADFVRQWIEQRAATSAGQHNISMTVLATLPIPLPPLAEQEQLVAEVERRLSVIEGLEAAVETNLTRADRLRQSILSEAFSGRLPSEQCNEV